MDKIEIILTAIGTGLSVILAVVGAVAWMFRKYAKMEVERSETKNRVASLEEKASALPCREHEKDMRSLREELRQVVKDTVGELPCKEHEKTLAVHSQDIRDLKRLTTENNGILTELSKWVMKIDESMIDSLARKASPLKMTEDGLRLFAESHAKDALEKMKDGLMARIGEMSPRTEYDVDQAALDVLLKSLWREEFDDVKRYVYYSPDRITTADGKSVRFDMFAIVRLMAIALRDMYLDAHPETRKANVEQ